MGFCDLFRRKKKEVLEPAKKEPTPEPAKEEPTPEPAKEEPKKKAIVLETDFTIYKRLWVTPERHAEALRVLRKIII